MTEKSARMMVNRLYQRYFSGAECPDEFIVRNKDNEVDFYRTLEKIEEAYVVKLQKEE